MPKTIFRKEKTSQVKQLGPNGQWPNHLENRVFTLSFIMCFNLCFTMCFIVCFNLFFCVLSMKLRHFLWWLVDTSTRPMWASDKDWTFLWNTNILLNWHQNYVLPTHIYIYIYALPCCAMWIVSCKMATMHSNFSQLFWIRRPIETNYSGIHFLRLRNKNDCT